MANNTALAMDNQSRCNAILLPTQVLTGQGKNGVGTMDIYLNNGYIMEDEEDTMNEDENWLDNETEEEVPIKCPLKPLEEQVLSQKLSQLSTSDQPTQHINMNNGDINENIPDYLSKGSKSFEKVLSHHASSNDMIEELRQMAVLIYQISMNNLEKTLWTAYLKAGTGQLKSNQMNMNSIDPCIWPIEVQSMMKKSTINKGDHTACLTYVNKYLSELDKKMEEYEIHLNIAKNRLSEYLPVIEAYVQQKLESFRLDIEHRIALVQFSYNDRILELQYLQYKPTPHQKQTVKQLSHAKYQQETTKEEYNLLKQRISITKLSQTAFELPEEPLFTKIDDSNIRQKFCNQYINVAKRARQDMMQLYLSSAKAQMDKYNKQFNNKYKQFWFEQRQLPNDKKLSLLVIQLMEQRWKNMSESVKRVYKYKLSKFELLHSNSVEP